MWDDGGIMFRRFISALTSRAWRNGKSRGIDQMIALVLLLVVTALEYWLFVPTPDWSKVHWQPIAWSYGGFFVLFILWHYLRAAWELYKEGQEEILRLRSELADLTDRQPTAAHVIKQKESQQEMGQALRLQTAEVERLASELKTLKDAETQRGSVADKQAVACKQAHLDLEWLRWDAGEVIQPVVGEGRYFQDVSFGPLSICEFLHFRWHSQFAGKVRAGKEPLVCTISDHPTSGNSYALAEWINKYRPDASASFEVTYWDGEGRGFIRPFGVNRRNTGTIELLAGQVRPLEADALYWRG